MAIKCTDRNSYLISNNLLRVTHTPPSLDLLSNAFIREPRQILKNVQVIHKWLLKKESTLFRIGGKLK